MVLLHDPTSSGKLKSIWEGPYEVWGALCKTLYTISVPKKRSQVQNVHVNKLNPWHTPTANLFRVVVGQDSVGSDEPPRKVSLGKTIMTEAQQGELNKTLNEFHEVVTDNLDQTSAAQHVIDTGQLPPVQSYPYRIAPAWKDLHREMKQLLDQGILEPSHSS